VRSSLSALLLIASLASACGGSAPSDPATAHPSSLASVALGSPSPVTKAAKEKGDSPAGVDAVAHDRYLPMWKHPGGDRADFAFDARGASGHGIAPMLVDGRRTIDGERWLRILLPIRPNGASAWARADDVDLISRREEIVVDLSERMLWHYADDEVVNRFHVGVGTPSTPTGTGTFYVWQRVPFSNPNQPYGIFALGLSGFSPVLSDWPGGGRMAIHGTPYASDRGRPVSHGCVRVYNADMKHLTDVRLGTPVIIRR
jgi:lipoprotein-anchoring transpeptidase ErfK/SrfK